MGLWKRFKNAVFGKPPVNVMNVSTSTKIKREASKSGVSVYEGDIHGAGVRVNVGVYVPDNASEVDIKAAVQAFIHAADALGISETYVPRDNIPVYREGHMPTF